MTLYIIIGILIAFGLYLLFSKRNQKASLQSALNQHVSHNQSHSEMHHDEMNHDAMKHNEMNHSNHKSGHGCCG